MALRAERSGARPHEKNLENSFAFLEFFKCLSIKATPCLEKDRAFQFVKEYSPKSLRNREGFWYNRRKPPREAPSWKSTPKTPAAKQWLLT